MITKEPQIPYNVNITVWDPKDCRDIEDVKREQREYHEKQKARYAPHRKYGFVKNLKK